MATPLAVVRAAGEAARRGILMRSGEAFQLLRLVDTVVFDKTGTLTEGRPHLVTTRAYGLPTDELLRLAASAELPSEHPLARAIVEGARTRGIELPEPGEFAAHPGRGVEASVAGHRVVVGTAWWLHERGVDPSPLRAGAEDLRNTGETAVFVAVDGRPVGVLGIADRLKPDAREAVQVLRRKGLRVVMLTGDDRRTAEAVAREAGVDAVVSEVYPAEKAEAVRRMQQEGRRVAYVGDGINDAPALMQADVGIALGAGTDIALESADVVLVGDRLMALVEAVDLAARSYRMTVTNVGLALAFNGFGVLAALSGQLAPVWAMLAMAASVATVLGRSLAMRL
jgi:heavy metal translocating P-type ATPase